MQERNVISGMLASWLTSFIEFVEPVKWFIVAALCLIIADFKFGIEASKKRGETIRKSRVLFVIYGCEINSCFNNYFESRGSKFRINIFKWFKNKADIIEPERKKNV